VRGHKLVRIALYITTALVIAVVGLLLFLQTRPGSEWLGRIAAGQAQRFVNGEVSVGSIRGNLLSSVTLHDVVLSRNGQPVVSIERMSAEYDLSGLLGGGDLAFDDILLVRPEIHLVRGPEGLVIADLFGGNRSPGDPEAPVRRLSIAPIVISEGHVVIGPEVVADAGGFRVPDELRDVEAHLAIERGNDGLRVLIDHLSFRGTSPEFTLAKLSGGVRYADSDLLFDELTVQTSDSQFTLDGSIRNVSALGES